MKVHHGSTLIMIDTYFSPLSFFFSYPLQPVLLFFLVIKYAYHYQSVKAILLVVSLGPRPQTVSFYASNLVELGPSGRFTGSPVKKITARLLREA